VEQDTPNGPFLDVGSIFPGEVEPVCVEPLTPASEALRTMLTHRYSQLPVVSDGMIRGVFSHWSLTQHLVNHPKLALRDVAVEDVMEELPSVTVHDSLDTVLAYLEKFDAVLVTSPRGLQAVATSYDALVFFYGVARPIVLLQEIELSLRSLISSCLNHEELMACIEASMGARYATLNRPLPTSLQQLTFDEYRSLISANKNWRHFDGVLGRNRALVNSKLEVARRIRNQIVHFREPLSVEDYETLVTTRNWLFDKTRMFQRSIEAGDGE